jgi:glycosyltransferase involved in cell wall biosynthesis
VADILLRCFGAAVPIQRVRSPGQRENGFGESSRSKNSESKSFGEPGMPANDSLRIGVWFETDPLTRFADGEAAQLTIQLVEAISARRGVRWLFAVPGWADASLRTTLADRNISSSTYEIVVSRSGVPVVVRLLRSIAPSGGSSAPSECGRTLKNIAPKYWAKRWIAAPLAGLAATASFVVTATVFAIAIAALAASFDFLTGSWRLLSIAALSAIAVVSIRAAKRLFQRLSALGAKAAERILARNPAVAKAITVLAKPFHEWRDGIRWKVGRATSKAWRLILDHDFKLLARNALRRDDVDVWFVADPRHHTARLLKKPKVVAVPEIAAVDLPVSCSTDDGLAAIHRVRELVGAADFTVSHSEYVCREHVQGYLGIPPQRTTVIRQAPLSLQERFRAATEMFDGSPRDAANSLAIRFVRRNLSPPSWTTCVPREYLANFPFDEVPFLFAPSEYRPRGNVLNLFRAFEIVLRKRYRNLKLFIACDLERNDVELRRYLSNRRLELDVVSLPRMTDEVRAAFYCLAALSVDPSLFERAIPAPFAESISMSTPIVMSSIPMTREVVPDDLAGEMLFDPHDPDSMAAAILRGLDHREQLLQRQRRLYQEMLTRTVADAANDYFELFRRAASANRGTGGDELSVLPKVA